MKRKYGFQARIMNINYASNMLKNKVLDELIAIEKRISFDDTQAEEVSKGLLLRYAFLSRLVSSLDKLLQNEDVFFDYYRTKYSSESATLEAEIVYNKYFSKRLNMSFKDYLTKRSEIWYSAKDLSN